MRSVAVLVGSLRRDSINRKLAHAMAKLAADKLEFRFVELGDVPLYNEDLPSRRGSTSTVDVPAVLRHRFGLRRW